MSNYHELSAVIGHYPDLAIFRKFRTANAQNLLFLQAQITNRSYELRSAIERDESSSIEKQRKLTEYVQSLENWEATDDKPTQWELILELRGLLSQYNTALIQANAIFNLPPVNKTHPATLLKLFAHGGNITGFLKGFEDTAWAEADDLTSLAESADEKDIVSSWIDGPLLSWFFRRIGHRFSQTTTINDPSISKTPIEVPLVKYPKSTAFISAVSTVFASTLPPLSSFALYYIKSPVVRLGMIVVFTFIFSLIVAIFTNAKRSEIFMATATFTAVLIVFVGSNDSNQCVRVAAK